MKLLVFAAVVIILEQVLAKECSEAPDVDGCSIPSWIPYKDRFTPACYKHDVCYACGTALGISRVICDRRFRSNCIALCKNKRICKRSANWYYKAVRWFGAFAYQTTSPAWCGEEWVSACML
ncbi:uncharacterized protein LOC123523683 [Mercenaria mercenaria]|uniref:uncharacterized protein LOC123523683 n=1 Tax=Mercenaria mercenaria TaxID=6596 RepID=UPI001E1DBB1D|nr:uncharacterized protein LOC123523683 [Mercenaria mercenaria]